VGPWAAKVPMIAASPTAMARAAVATFPSFLTRELAISDGDRKHRLTAAFLRMKRGRVDPYRALGGTPRRPWTPKVSLRPRRAASDSAHRFVRTAQLANC
jgi:hypothetical protein